MGDAFFWPPGMQGKMTYSQHPFGSRGCILHMHNLNWYAAAAVPSSCMVLPSSQIALYASHQVGPQVHRLLYQPELRPCGMPKGTSSALLWLAS